MSRLTRALTFLRPFRLEVGGVLGLALIVSALAAVEPLLLKYIFDRVVGDRSMRAIAYGIAGLLSLGVTREIVTAVQNWLTWKTRIDLQFSLTEKTVGKLQQLPVSFHRSTGVGSILTRLDRGVQGFVAAVCEFAFSTVPAAAYLVLAVTMMFHLDVRLGIVALIFAPLPVAIARLAMPLQLERERSLMEHWTRIYARFTEVLGGIVTVKSFAMEDREKQRFLHQVDVANGVVKRGVGLDSAVSATQNTVTLIARVAVIAAGAMLVAPGAITLGTLVAFLGYLGGMFAPIQSLSGVYKTLRTAARPPYTRRPPAASNRRPAVAVTVARQRPHPPRRLPAPPADSSPPSRQRRSAQPGCASIACASSDTAPSRSPAG